LKKATKERRKRKRALKRWKKRRWAAANLKRKRITLGLKARKEPNASKKSIGMENRHQDKAQTKALEIT